MGDKLYGEGLRRTFVSEGGTTQAIDDITIGVSPHEFVSLLGPSGCGKTTLLNMFAGFDRPTAGRVYLDGREISSPGPDRGVVFQEHALFPWLTVEDNVGAGKRVRSRPVSQRREIIDHQLAMVGLEGFARHYPHQLSGGMKQRVAIARALANEPEVLLMDEPFAALDAFTRTQLQNELIRIWRETRKTIVFVTHNIEEAVLLSDRIAVMTARPGRIRAIIDVKLDKPRDPNSAEFNAIERSVRQMLWDETKADLH